MKKFLLILVPLLLSQCTNAPKDAEKQAVLNEINKQKAISLQRLKQQETLMFIRMMSLHSEVIKLLKRHRNDKFPIKPLSTSEYEERIDKNACILGVLMGINDLIVSGLSIQSQYQYLHLISCVNDFMISGNAVPEAREYVLQILEKYIDGPFPLKPIPTKEIEITLLRDLLDVESRNSFNIIIKGISKQEYEEILKKLEISNDGLQTLQEIMDTKNLGEREAAR